MTSLLSSNKGQGGNYFAAITFLFGFGVLSIIGVLLTQSIIEGFETSGLYTGELAVAGENFKVTYFLWDNLIVLFMVILIIGVGVTSFKLASAPIFFLVSFVMGALYGLISYFFNYLFAQIVSEAIFTGVLVFFPLTIIICTNLHWVMLVLWVVGSITLYAKREKGQFLT